MSKRKKCQIRGRRQTNDLPFDAVGQSCKSKWHRRQKARNNRAARAVQARLPEQARGRARDKVLPTFVNEGHNINDTRETPGTTRKGRTPGGATIIAKLTPVSAFKTAGTRPLPCCSEW